MDLLEFSPKEFVDKQMKEIKETIGGERALIAVSGGVDSATCATTRPPRYGGENLLCVMLDDAFMREGEPERVAQLLSRSPLNLPVRIVNVEKPSIQPWVRLPKRRVAYSLFKEPYMRMSSRPSEA